MSNIYNMDIKNLVDKILNLKDVDYVHKIQTILVLLGLRNGYLCDEDKYFMELCEKCDKDADIDLLVDVRIDQIGREKYTQLYLQNHLTPIFDSIPELHEHIGHTHEFTYQYIYNKKLISEDDITASKNKDEHFKHLLSYEQYVDLSSKHIKPNYLYKLYVKGYNNSIYTQFSYNNIHLKLYNKNISWNKTLSKLIDDFPGFNMVEYKY